MAWDDNLTDEAAPTPTPAVTAPTDSVIPAEDLGVTPAPVWDEGIGGDEGQPREPEAWHSFLTGQGRKEEGIFDLSDLGTAGPFVDEDKQIPMSAAGPILSGMFTTTDPRELANIVKKHLPGATITKDRYENPVIEYNGNKFYTNPPGLSMQDVSAGALEALALTPLGRVMKGKTIFRSVMKGLGIGGAAEGGLQAAREYATEQLGGDVQLNDAFTRIGLAAAGGAAGAGLSEPVSALAKRGRSLVKNVISERNVAALMKRAGVDWTDIPESQRGKIYNALKVFTPAQINKVLGDKENAKILHRAAIAKDMDVPLTKGQVTRDPRQLAKEYDLEYPGGKIAKARKAQPDAMHEVVESRFKPQPQTIKELQSLENEAWKEVRSQAAGKRLVRPDDDSLYTSAAKSLSDADLTLTDATPEASRLMNKINKMAQKDWIPAQAILNLREEISAMLAPGNQIRSKDALAIKAIRDSAMGYLDRGLPELGGYIDDAMEYTVSRGIAQKKSELVVKELIGGYGKATKKITPAGIEKRIDDLFAKHGDFLRENFDMRELSDLANLKTMAQAAQEKGTKGGVGRKFTDQVMRVLGPLAIGGASLATHDLGLAGAAAASLGAAGTNELRRRGAASLAGKAATSFDYGDLLPNFFSGVPVAGGGLLGKQFEEQADSILQDFR